MKYVLFLVKYFGLNLSYFKLLWNWAHGWFQNSSCRIIYISDEFIEFLKVAYIVYLWIYIKISCICKNNTSNHLKFGQQLLGFTMMVNRLW